MIARFSVTNYKAFAERVDLDFFANGNIKRLDYNYVSSMNKNILKTMGFYGPNNTGKTCIISAFASLRALMLNEVHDDMSNSFANKGDITSFEVEYCVNGRYYTYSLSYNNRSKRYESEKLCLKEYRESSSAKEVIFERNENKLNWIGITSSLKRSNLSTLFSLSFPFMLLFDDSSNKEMMEAKNDYLEFANSLILLKMNESIDISKTISLMQSDTKASKFIKEFVKNSDLHISDFGFDDNVISDTDIEDKLKEISTNPTFIKDTLKFYSKHNGYRVPSIFFDSLGTLKLVALSGYIYEALNKGKILLVDEIDSSLHHILTKAIVTMFNNVLNKKAQLLFTTHDVLLLDLKELFRKDQIYLVDILNSYSSKITRLSEFTSRSINGIRGDEDITTYYLKGQFGSIPTPDLFASLEEATSDE